MLYLADLIITISYFSIPVQILTSLDQYPNLAVMPFRILVLLVLFAMFILLCGVGHLLRFLELQQTTAFVVNNAVTAAVSLLTAMYLLPLIPNLLGMIDEAIRDSIKLNLETAESKAKLMTFMAFLCHEIRNPLFAITSSARFLSDTDMTEEQETGVGSIFDSSLLMLRLVNDVLDLSKIDAGKLELEERDFDLHRMLENLIVNMKLQIEQKHGDDVQLFFHVAPNVPRIVYGDSTRMLQIVYNLMSNASKFTEQGHVRLKIELCDDPDTMMANTMYSSSTVSTATAGVMTAKRGGANKGLLSIKVKPGRRASDRGNYEMTNLKDQFSMGLLDSMEEGLRTDHEVVSLLITIEDTGCGIDSGRIGQVFEPYSQSKLSDYRIHGGTGLGLPIISSLIKLMGGHISVTSAVGTGSTFTLLMPLHVSRDQSACIDEASSDMSDPFLTARRLPVYRTQKKMELETSKAGDPVTLRSVGASEDISALPGGPPEGALSMNLASPSSANPNSDGVTDVAAKKMSNRLKPPQLPKFNLPKGKGVVLVVDDNNVNRKILGKMLQFYHLEYETAENGQEAVDIMRASRNVTGDPNAQQFGLVFMDLSMPVMDGFDATRTIRSDGLSLPIVALTANALSQEKQRAYEAGATEFHTKPILREDLHGICHAHLSAPGRHPWATGAAAEQ